MFFLPNARVAQVKVSGESSQSVAFYDVLHTRDRVTKYLFGRHPAEQITGVSVPALHAFPSKG